MKERNTMNKKNKRTNRKKPFQPTAGTTDPYVRGQEYISCKTTSV